MSDKPKKKQQTAMRALDPNDYTTAVAWGKQRLKLGEAALSETEQRRSRGVVGVGSATSRTLHKRYPEGKGVKVGGKKKRLE